MTPHISGTSLDAQIRYATGAHDIVKRYLAGESQEQVNLIVENGQVSCLSLSAFRSNIWESWLMSKYASKAYGQREKEKK